MAVPAAADDPIVFRDQVVFDAVNPCTDELHTVTIDFLIEIREGENEFMARVRRTGHTSDGFYMNFGKEVFVAVDGSENAFFTDPWVNPDTGQKFVAQGRFAAEDGEVLVDDFRLVCRTG